MKDLGKTTLPINQTYNQPAQKTWLPNFFEGVGMRTKEEIKKALKELRKTRKHGSPLTEPQNIAWHGTKQALEWVLKQTDTLLTY